MDVIEAQALVAKEKLEREKRCQERIQAALQDERCTLEITMTLSSGGITPTLLIIAQ